MELEDGHRNSVIKRRNPIEFGLVRFALTSTLILYGNQRLMMELEGGHRNSVIKRRNPIDKIAIQRLARCALGYKGVPTAFCVLEQLLQFKLRNVEVKLQWVPAHIGIYGNEEAEKLANTAHLNGIEYSSLIRLFFYLYSKEIDASQAERLGRSCLSIPCSALLLARSAQEERDNESCFFVQATGVYRFIRRYHVNI
ncbi:hypothetical protein EVAR_82238_1 [Eumeta japonica]|uniref:Uncharacterized protein n=1 Tax=Eumeta variegata TaxID=151549 RepID=A0A4C1W135_EUMVA|nr:hypothetical protein EVAR_82238_1 [Eumeta japonica]